MPPQLLNVETSSMHFFSLSRNKIKHLGPLCYSICFVLLVCAFKFYNVFKVKILFFLILFFGLFGFSFVPPQLLLWVYYLTCLMAFLAFLFVLLASLFIPFVLLFGCWLALLVASWFLSLLVSSYVIAIWFLLLSILFIVTQFLLLCCLTFFSIAWLFLLLLNIVRTQIEI